MTNTHFSAQAVFDRSGGLVDWDAGFADEFASVREDLAVGVTLDELVRLAALPSEAKPGPVGHPHAERTYRNGNILVAVQYVALRNGHRLRLARAVSSDFELRRSAAATMEAVSRVKRAADREVRAAKDHAESANRAKDEFLASMSHEIRTPLNAIIGFADIMRQKMFGPIESQRYCGYVEDIHKSGQHLLHLIDDILDVTRLESSQVLIEREPIDLRATVVNLVDLLAPGAQRKGLRLDVEWQPGAPETISSDATRLRQVLINLVGNAIKFSDAGAVRIRVRCHETDPHGVRIEVVDQGIGIPPDAQKRIFQKFTQADPTISSRFGGMGLGLAISKALVEKLGGTIGLESAPGAGSTFWIELTAQHLPTAEKMKA